LHFPTTYPLELGRKSRCSSFGKAPKINSDRMAVSMPLNRERFQIGEFDCIALSDGTFNYPTNWMFSNVPPDQLEHRLRERNLPVDQIESPYTCLLLRTGRHRVLIDTGAGALAPTTGDLPKNLAAEGIRAEEITHVVLTHGHPDHIGGVLGPDGRPSFPNATYVMSRMEWDFWTTAPDLRNTRMDEHMQQMLVSVAQKNLLPLEGCIELLDGEGEKEIVSGIRAIPAPGHTPGHIAVLVESAKAQLLHISDAVLNPLHLENPTWRNVFDLDEEAAVTTKRRLLDRAAADKIKVLAYHFPFPGLGHVESEVNSWRWQAGS
jgi:glyoxylase-like metal-dependent hydrolase (beta-lactamase superfamily II)